MAPYAAVFSFLCTVVISVLVVCVLMVVSIPNNHAVAFYLMGIENVLSLAMGAMLIAAAESVIERFVIIVALRITHVNNAENAATAYYAAAKKDIEETAPMQRMHFAAQMEVFGGMKEFLKLQLEKAAADKALRTKVESSVVSDACVGSSSVVSDAIEPVAEKRPTDASDAGSSVRSAALTACV
jgi:hypothetical protein